MFEIPKTLKIIYIQVTVISDMINLVWKMLVEQDVGGRRVYLVGSHSWDRSWQFCYENYRYKHFLNAMGHHNEKVALDLSRETGKILPEFIKWHTIQNCIDVFYLLVNRKFILHICSIVMYILDRLMRNIDIFDKYRYFKYIDIRYLIFRISKISKVSTWQLLDNLSLVCIVR